MLSSVRVVYRLSPLLALLLASCGGAGSGDAGGGTRTTTTSSMTDVAGIVTVRRETTVTEPVAPTPAASPSPQSSPQSGLLTAGDIDDALNPAAYARYAGRFAQAAGKDLPFVALDRQVEIAVVDASGRPVPFARVEVAREGEPLRLRTAADGRVAVQPLSDRVPGNARVTIDGSAGTVTQTVAFGGANRTVSIRLSGAAKPARALDIALVLDATGSMGDEMAYLRSELASILARVRDRDQPVDLRIALILYRDEGDDYVVRATAFSTSFEEVRTALARAEADGGGDTPEAVDAALTAANRLQWRPDAAKALLLVADAPPHQARMKATFAEVAGLRSRGVQIVPVAASGVEDSAQYLMRAMAVATRGRYIFLTDDSGVGDAHAEPDVPCYLVTRLDGLIVRVLIGLAEGRRVEPAAGEVVRRVGEYDAGRCRDRQQDRG